MGAMGDLMSGTVAVRKSTILMPCGGNKGCLTPNEHPPLIGHYSPSTKLQVKPGKRLPHRLPSYVSDQTTLEQAPTAIAATRRAVNTYEEDERVRGLTPDPPVTTYQRDFEMWREDRTNDDSASHVSGRTKVQSLDLASVRSGKTWRSSGSGENGEGPHATGGIGGSKLTARALEQIEAMEEERDRMVSESPRTRKPAFGDKFFGDPTPLTHPQTGKTVRPHHHHLYLPLTEQLKRIIPDLTPASSAAVSDRSHYNDAKARAERYNKERARSEAGSSTARAWYGDADKARAGRQRKGGMRVRLETTKMFRARPIGAENKTGEQLLNEIDAARAERKATGKIAPFIRENKIVPFTREQEAAARVAQEDARSEKLPVRRLGQRNLPSVLGAGWHGVEEVDRLQKSRSPSQGGANIDTQAVLSPSILKARLKAQEERARRRHLLPDEQIATPRLSPHAKAFTSIQTMTMLGYDYRVVNGMQNKDGHVWRYTPPPKPFTPPTPVHLHTSPRSKMSDAA